ncbi:hypothetical protein N7476_004644, partial [Penicillium atrosanguineum]
IRRTGQYSNLEVKCQHLTFHVHRCIVCPQSIFFDRAVKGEFKEASSGVITIHDDPLIATKMFDFLYSGKYDDRPDVRDDLPDDQDFEAPQDDTDLQNSPIPGAFNVRLPAQTNVQVYTIADKYAIGSLQNLSLKKLESNLNNEWTDLGFLDTVKDVYEGQCPPNSDLRELLCKFAIQHLSGLKDSPRFREVRKKYPEFTDSLSQLLMERVVELEKFM